MPPLPEAIQTRLPELPALCGRFGVQRLELFGSAAGEGFDPARSDADFIVDFGPGAQADLFERYFGLNAALAELFGRPVDLVMAGAMRNPHFIAAVNRTRQTLYARPVAEAA